MDLSGQLQVSAAMPAERTPEPTEERSELVPMVVRMVLEKKIFLPAFKPRTFRTH